MKKLLRHDSFKAIAMALASFFLFAIVDVFAKWMGQHYAVPVVLLCCGVAGLAMVVPYILWRKGWRGFIPRRPLRLHIARAMQTAINGYLIVTALQYVPLADFYGIVFSTPFVTAVASVIFFGERVGWHRWGAIALGFFGIWVIVAPSYHEFNIGTAAALCVPFTLAANAIFLRKIGRDEYPALFPFYSFLGILVLNGPLTFMMDAPLPAVQDLWLFIPYAAAVVFAIVMLGRAYAIAPLAATVAPLQYTSMLWGCLFGSFVFDDHVTWNTWAGAAVIVVAGLYLLHRERIHARSLVLQTAN